MSTPRIDHRSLLRVAVADEIEARGGEAEDTRFVVGLKAWFQSKGDPSMIRALVLTAALAFAGAAAAQDPHAGHHPPAQAAAPQPDVTTVPSNGAMIEGSPERFTATFPHPMILKTVTLAAEGQEPIVVTAPAAPAAATISVALPRLAPGTYTAAWTAEGPDGHKMSGTVSFMVH